RTFHRAPQTHTRTRHDRLQWSSISLAVLTNSILPIPIHKYSHSHITLLFRFIQSPFRLRHPSSWSSSGSLWLTWRTSGLQFINLIRLSQTSGRRRPPEGSF
ncbi:hypothetical protein PQX77_013957, partial [Marasmius sp. AFHP31]